MGSTAAHCYARSGDTSWFNSGSPVGIQSNIQLSKDAMLLAPGPGSTFAPDVFASTGYGPLLANTSVILPLLGASVLPIGSPIAFSGQTTGSHVSSVAATGGKNSYPSLYGATVTVSSLTATWSKCTAPGDSGGTWITSDAYNNAYAHGTHYGGALIPGFPEYGAYASYIDVNTTSAAVQATINTY